MGLEKCTEGFSPALRSKSCRSTFLKSRQVTSSGKASAVCRFNSKFMLFVNGRIHLGLENFRLFIPPPWFPLQGSIGGPSSGPRPSRKPGGRLCLRRRGRGGRQPRSSRAQRSLPGGHLLARHCRNDRRRGGESLHSVEMNWRKRTKDFQQLPHQQYHQTFNS